MILRTIPGDPDGRLLKVEIRFQVPEGQSLMRRLAQMVDTLATAIEARNGCAAGFLGDITTDLRNGCLKGIAYVPEGREPEQIEAEIRALVEVPR